MENYIGSEKHLNNVNNARKLGLVKINENKKNRIKQYYLNPNKCIFCNKSILYNKKNNKFCNSSCAASFNNLNRILSIETKEKIGKSLSGIKRNIKTIRKCVICNNEFYPIRKKNGQLSKAKCCSNECRIKQKSINMKNLMIKRISDGTHEGWTTRNIISYPEQFFINVLKNNNIEFQHNYPISKKDLGLNDSHNYFLNFYIKNKNIDLEIDGNQHKYRKKHDIERDKVLIKNKYNVYRINWKNINNRMGKLYIKNEINKFLEYYNNL